MQQKQITINDLAKGNIESGVAYTIIKNPRISLRDKLDDFLEKYKLDEYSRMCRKDYRNGITNDLSYDDTLSKCSDKQVIKMIWVEGYTTFVNDYNRDEINPEVERKVKRLLNDNRVGYILDDSCGCYLCCRSEDYKKLCDYLSVEYNKNDDNKEYYYNSLFDDILEMFRDYCDVIIANRKGWSERESYKIDKRIHEIARYIIVNLECYVDYFVSAKPNSDDKDEYWVNRLWIEANKDYDNKR